MNLQQIKDLITYGAPLVGCTITVISFILSRLDKAKDKNTKQQLIQNTLIIAHVSFSLLGTVFLIVADDFGGNAVFSTLASLFLTIRFLTDPRPTSRSNTLSLALQFAWLTTSINLAMFQPVLIRVISDQYTLLQNQEKTLDLLSKMVEKLK